MKDLIKQYFKGDRVIWIVYIILSLVSLVAVFSASSNNINGTGNSLTVISNNIIHHLLGFVLLLGVYNMNLRLIKILSFIGIGIVILLLLFLLLAGNVYQGAARSIAGFQPSELAKILLIVISALCIDEFQKEEALQKYFKFFCWIFWITVGLIFPMNLSQSIIISVPIIIMLIVGSIPWKRIGFLIAIPLLLIVIVSIIASIIPKDMQTGAVGKLFAKFRYDTWIGRFRNHIDLVESWETLESTSEKWKLIRKYDQVIYAKSAIYDGKYGVAPGNSVWRNRLQEVSKDFIYALIVEEYGIIGGIGIILLYLILLFRGGILARQSHTIFQAVVIIGAITLIVFQAFVHIAVSVGFIPVTGQTLPLISKGGSSIIVMSILFGLILGISRRIEDCKEKNTTIEQDIAQSPIPTE